MPSRWWGRAGTVADAGGSATAGTMSEEKRCVPMVSCLHYSLALFEFAGVDADAFPIPADEVPGKLEAAREALWVNYDANPNANGLTAAGGPFYASLQNLSGGPRPIYPLSFGGFQELLQSLAGDNGTIKGILY